MASSNFFNRRKRNERSHDPAAITPIGQDDIVRRVQLLDTFEAAGLGWFWATDHAGRLIYLTPSATKELNRDLADLIGMSLNDLLSTDSHEDDEREQRPLAFLLSARNSISELPVKVAAKSGNPADDRYWELAGKPHYDADGDFAGYRGSAKDITATREKQIDATRLAQYDSLTGLANRHRVETRLDRTLTAYRNAKRACAFLMLDLDRFKAVNDTLGHPAGDELLKQVAGRLQNVVGERGEIGRLGGDEFTVMLPDMDDRGALGELGERIIQMVSQPYSVNGSRAIIGTSIGVAIAPYDGLDVEEIIKSADLALYAAKAAGRGQYRFYHSDLKDGAKHRRQLEEDLRDALGKNEIEMHYQPIVDAGTRKVACFEALMRWRHGERGWITPGEFIPVAEDINLIKPLGEFALERVCQQAAQWNEGLGVAVNVSAIQFAHDDFAEKVEQVLKSTGLTPSRLILEITESVFLGDTGHAQKMFANLKRLGVKLALDDFGTGYSSLSYLRNAPFDKIKIDQSFVRGATETGNNNAAILSAIVSLADALDMETVAEGVETQDELALVTKRGATHIQGFIFSAALTNEQVAEQLESGDLVYEPRGPQKYRADRRTVFRRIGFIHEDHRYRVVMRNLSKTGAMLEGLTGVPEGTECVLDLGGGQLAVAVVRRSSGYTQGVEFETPLISDGADGLCTRHRVSPYEIEAAGRPLQSLPQDAYAMLFGEGSGASSRRKFIEVDIAYSD